jgi:hypothetical protein
MIRAFAYDRKTRTLEVVFNAGQIYYYENVPLAEYHGLIKAESKGKYMQANIIDAYPYHQIGRHPLE